MVFASLYNPLALLAISSSSSDSSGADNVPSSFTALPSLFCSSSLFLLLIFAVHKLHAEWSSRFCTEERSHREYLPNCCFSLKFLLLLSLPKLSLTSTDHGQTAGKCCLRCVVLASPSPVSLRFLCLAYCIWEQNFFCARSTMVKYSIW